jgi:hypothetical protein
MSCWKVAVLGFGMWAGVTQWGPAEDCPIVLTDVSAATQIGFRHHDGSTGEYRIVEYVSAGLALFDYDGDGLIDMYFLNGAPPASAAQTEVPRDALYRNRGAWRFEDVTDSAGLGDRRHGLGVAAADMDNDGDQDLYVNNDGPNVLYRNEGNGRFRDVTAEAGVANGDRVGAAVCWLDVDRDGRLDLFVSNYIVHTPDRLGPTTMRGISAYPSPLAFEPETNSLYRNRGDDRFEDVSESSGIAAYRGSGMGAVCADYDLDGDTDIFVCNDMRANFLLQNDGKGVFTDVALFEGTAFDVTGTEQGSMGVDCGDFNNDGWFDFMMTNYQDEMPVLYRNSGKGFFDDVSRLTGAGISAVRPVTWGVGWVDFDNDGDRDIFMATGHLEDNASLKDDTVSYETPNILMMNLGHETFVDVSAKAGSGLAVKRSSRGVGFDDLDNDGDIDVVILNSRREPTILRNDSPVGNHWLQIRLQGTSLHGITANRDGVGSYVRVTAGDLVQVDEVHSGRGYQGHHGMRLHFGLGKRDQIDMVEVRWLGGKVERFTDLQVDRQVTLVQGTGQPQ